MAQKCKCRVTGEEGYTDSFIKIDGHYYKSQDIYDEHQSKLQEAKSGIYKITNIKNNKVYVGESMDIQRRWKEHINELEENRHQNYFLQQDFNEYGINNFKFEILQKYSADSIITTKTRLLMLEYKYILKFKKINQSLYNIENTLLKLLDGDKGVFDKKGFDYQHLCILINQITIYKFIPKEDNFVLVKRNTPLIVFNELYGTKKNHTDKIYEEFLHCLHEKHSNDIDKIIKSYKLKYKDYCEREKIIDEVTEYGIGVFKDIINNNDIFKLTKANKPIKLTDNQIQYSNFINKISDDLNFGINLYTTIKYWLIEINIIKQCNNHTYATEFSLNNNFIINNKRYEEKSTGVVYYTMVINETCQNYVYDQLNKMSMDEKKNKFLQM